MYLKSVFVYSVHSAVYIVVCGGLDWQTTH